jgi:hypothetical protein
MANTSTISAACMARCADRHLALAFNPIDELAVFDPFLDHEKFTASTAARCRLCTRAAAARIWSAMSAFTAV